MLKCVARRLIRVLSVILFVMLVFNFFDAQKINAETEDKRILIIASYNTTNEWEIGVLDGISQVIPREHIVNIEYLDANDYGISEYYNNFLELLNIKYKNAKLDCIILLDNEALEFARKSLFNKDAFCYKTPMFFAGVNGDLSLTENEKEYVSGIMDGESPLNTINIMISALPELKHVYFLIDDSTYCKKMVEDIKGMSLMNIGIDVKIVRILDRENMDNLLTNLDAKENAILLSGTHMDIYSDSKLPSQNIFNYVRNITKVPIFTTLYNYVNVGAVGGSIMDAVELGKLCGGSVEKMLQTFLKQGGYFVTPLDGALSKTVFNFKVIREYDINPASLPKDSIYINKKFYNMLLPKNIEYVAWMGIGIIFILSIMVLILLLSNKRNLKKEHLKLLEAQQREAIKNDYIIIMSHEFRTPLNIVKSIVELLIVTSKNGKLTTEFLMTKLNQILKNADRLHKSINNSIEVSKVESGIISMSFKMYNIVEVVEDVVMSTVDYANKYNIDLVFDTNEEEIYTAIDKKSIDKIILNLLSNAIKSIQGKGNIYVKCDKVEKDVVISIKDTGVGIGVEAQKHIFEKFYQVRNSSTTRSYEGSGLGLYIVKNFVVAHKGTIGLESQLGIGTTVTIKLPITVIDEYPLENEIGEDVEYLAKLEFSDLS